MLTAILICLLEAVMIVLLVRQILLGRTRLKAMNAYTATLRVDLQQVLNLIKRQNEAKGEASDEKEKLDRAPDSALADRADTLFRS